jgi:hypothetical protein
VGNRIQEAQSPEIGETAEEKSLSTGQLKYQCLRLAKQAFQGKVFRNKNTGKHIRVSQDGIMEWWRKSRRREHIVSIKLLDVFLKNAVCTGDAPDYKGRQEIESMSRFETGCKINGKPYHVVITTRKAVNDIDKFRYYALKDSGTAGE